MKARLFVCGAMAVCLSTNASFVRELRAGPVRSVLPSSLNAKALLSATTRHREWVSIGTESAPMLAFVVYPERSDKAPVLLVTGRSEPATPFVRAVADQLAAEGFVSIVPDLRAGLEAAKRYAQTLPSASATNASIDLDFANGRADISVQGPRGGAAHFALTNTEWPELVTYVSHVTGNNPPPIEGRTRTIDEHAMHMGHAMAMGAQQSGGSAAYRVIPGLGDKAPNLPASYYTATQTLAQSKLKKEWVDIPVGDVKVHTWVEYPAGNNKTGVVIVMQHGVGLDEWMRSVADQLAADGFIAIAPDAWSGTGPNGGNRDSFQFDDDAMRAAARITPDETQRRYKAAREWALRLPRANGKTGSIGFCAGGGNSFRFAGEVPELNAAAVFYGTPPSEDLVRKINAPVVGFYGENDARVTATVAPTTELMKKLDKRYESHIYPKVTHSFVYFQDLSVNRDAVADAWPRVIAFYNKYLK
jgi:carboxymethylenebutenolidase